MEKPFKNNYVHLEPFIHQVGGHSSMLCLDEATVCKPLVPRELKFYQTLPEPVQKFTPKFYGVIEVQVLPEDGGYVTLIATPPECYKPKVSNNKGHIRIRRSGSIEIDGEPRGLFEVDQTTSEAADVNRSGSKPMNPWVFKCHRTHLRNLISDIHHEGNSPNFILLENLTWKFTFPCILDLKMGTRQYGDTATLPKKQSKMYKVVSTTSGKLGARIGGMQESNNDLALPSTSSGCKKVICVIHIKKKNEGKKGETMEFPPTEDNYPIQYIHLVENEQSSYRVYQVTTQRFLCRNKFYGRSLSIAGFQQALRQFLHNGARLRSDVLPPLIRRLEELVVVLAHQDSVRFYTTSLLLLYEGNEVHSTEPCHFDFKNTSGLCEFDSTSRMDEDHHGCMGRRSSSAETLSPVPDGSFEKLITDDLPHHHRRGSSTLIYEESHGGSSSSPHDSSLSTPISPLPKTLPESSAPEPVVDVRMIDFAHSTHKELDDPVVYSGPDRGFLFGLENMIALLKCIERDHG